MQIESWSSTVEGYFKILYQMSVDLINWGLENLKFYGKFLSAKDILNQGVNRRRGFFAS